MNKSIGEKIKSLRLDAKMSQEALAKALYFSNRTISNWENNLREVSVSNLTKLADFFNVPISYFMDQSNGGAPITPQSKVVFQEIITKTIAIKQTDFYYLMLAIFINTLMIFIPFSNRTNAAVIFLLFWSAYLIYMIVRYTSLDRARRKVFLVPANAKVYFQTRLNNAKQKSFFKMYLFYLSILFAISFTYYAGIFAMINTYETNILFDLFISFFFLTVTIIQLIALFRILLRKSFAPKLPYLKDRIDLGMLIPRTIVTLHYSMQVFIIVLVSAYGHEVFPFDLLILNLFNGLLLFLILRIILMMNTNYFDSYELFSQTNAIETPHKLE
jgi:transcriptional regulator with XRE-family HTH domain